MLKVTDAHGAVWTVRRRWCYRTAHAGHLPMEVVWPFWFLAHWLGLPWRIAVFENGVLVDEVEVRGWTPSRQCMREISARTPVG